MLHSRSPYQSYHKPSTIPSLSPQDLSSFPCPPCAASIQRCPFHRAIPTHPVPGTNNLWMSRWKFTPPFNGKILGKCQISCHRSYHISLPLIWGILIFKKIGDVRSSLKISPKLEKIHGIFQGSHGNLWPVGAAAPPWRSADPSRPDVRAGGGSPAENLGSPRIRQGKSMGNPWEIHGKSMGNPWEIDGKSMGNPGFCR